MTGRTVSAEKPVTAAKIKSHVRAAIDAAFAAGSLEATVDYQGMRVTVRRETNSAPKRDKTAADAALDAWDESRP